VQRKKEKNRHVKTSEKVRNTSLSLEGRVLVFVNEKLQKHLKDMGQSL